MFTCNILAEDHRQKDLFEITLWIYGVALRNYLTKKKFRNNFTLNATLMFKPGTFCVMNDVITWERALIICIWLYSLCFFCFSVRKVEVNTWINREISVFERKGSKYQLYFLKHPKTSIKTTFSNYILSNTFGLRSYCYVIWLYIYKCTCGLYIYKDIYKNIHIHMHT